MDGSLPSHGTNNDETTALQEIGVSRKLELRQNQIATSAMSTREKKTSQTSSDTVKNSGSVHGDSHGHSTNPKVSSVSFKEQSGDESALDKQNNGMDVGKGEPASDGDGEDDVSKNHVGIDFEFKKKKKKKSKSKMKKGANRPSGFEDYYVDPPLTLDEFNEEKGLYDPSRTFTSRIQTAIQRYSVRRKFNEDRQNIWTKYLRYGGIDIGPKMFGGMDTKQPKVDTNGSDNDEPGDKATLKAKEYINEDILDSQLTTVDQEEYDSKYEVDFDSVIRGFFSMHLQGAVSMETEQMIKMYTGIVRNWLNYLLHHNVCNEYKAQIYAARKTCDVAEKELWALQKLKRKLPGEFSEACRLIYTPPPIEVTIDEITWDDVWTLPSSMTYAHAERSFFTAMAILGDDELTDRYNEFNESDTGTSVVQEVETSLEITAIEPPTKTELSAYGKDVAHGLKPVGRVRARTWYMDWELLPDLTEEEEAALPTEREAARRDFEFWIDSDTLADMFVGLKMTVLVKELNFGLCFIDKVKQTFPSFVNWLPNELMIGWRDHEWIPPNKEKILGRMQGLKEAEQEHDEDKDG